MSKSPTMKNIIEGMVGISDKQLLHGAVCFFTNSTEGVPGVIFDRCISAADKRLKHYVFSDKNIPAVFMSASSIGADNHSIRFTKMQARKIALAIILNITGTAKSKHIEEAKSLIDLKSRGLL